MYCKIDCLSWLFLKYVQVQRNPKKQHRSSFNGFLSSSTLEDYFYFCFGFLDYNKKHIALISQH